MKKILMIPALNPDQNLINFVAELKYLDPSMPLLIIDDGSDTRSASIFSELEGKYGCMICRHPENYGKGVALKTGISYILQHYPDTAGFITADADGQHWPTDVIRVANEMEQHPHEIILGTRDFSMTGVPFKSRWGNMITSGVFSALTGISCSDTQTGLRGIPIRYAGMALHVEGERYEYETHFLLRAAGYQIPLRELLISTVYLDNNSASHFRPIRDSFRIYRMIFIASFRRRKHKNHRCRAGEHI